MEYVRGLQAGSSGKLAKQRWIFAAAAAAVAAPVFGSACRAMDGGSTQSVGSASADWLSIS